MKLLNHLIIPIAIFIILILAGGIVFQQVENWRYIDSVYFTVVTATTIGYGDFSPQTDIGKIITMIFSFAGIGMAFYFFSLIGRYMFKKQLREKLREIGRIKQNKGIRKAKG